MKCALNVLNVMKSIKMWAHILKLWFTFPYYENCDSHWTYGFTNLPALASTSTTQCFKRVARVCAYGGVPGRAFNAYGEQCEEVVRKC